MVYAIISIGLLGFIVWSCCTLILRDVVMALLCREIEVINFTIGWKVSTLLTTFYSTNVNNYNQSAGNSGDLQLLTLLLFTPTLLVKKASIYARGVASQAPTVLVTAEEDKTLERGSSETIRESSFELFRNSFEVLNGKIFEETDNWLF